MAYSCVCHFFCVTLRRKVRTHMHRWVLLIGLWLAIAAQAAVYTPASVPNPKKQGQAFYVANPDAILPDSSVAWLNDCAARLEDATRVQLCVVALESIGGSEAFDFAYELFQRWGLGHEGQNTGVLMLFVLDSHDIRIMTGVGIEGVLTDAQCSKIVHDDMIPAFRAGAYGDGLCLGALRIYEICTDGEAPEELLTIRSVTNRGGYSDTDDLTDAELMCLVVALTFLPLLVFLIIYWASTKRCPQCGKRRAHATREKILVAATYAAAGQGLRTYRCSKCGNTFDVPFVIPRRQHTVYISGGGGRGGSFGGGSFSGGGSWGGGSTFGGGAGGRW